MTLEIRIPVLEEQDLLQKQMPDAEHAPMVTLERQDGGRGIYLAAWDGDTPVGHLFLRWSNTEIPRIVDEYPQVAFLHEAPEVCNVFVVPERRSEGIGSLLITEAMERSRQRGVRHLTICVDLDNRRAAALYEHLGFSDAGVGVFTTSGVYVDDAGMERPWQNGPQYLLFQEIESER